MNEREWLNAILDKVADDVNKLKKVSDGTKVYVSINEVFDIIDKYRKEWEMNDSELVEMLTLLKNQAKDIIRENDRHDTLIIDVKLDSFNFVIDSAIEFIQKSKRYKKWIKR